MNAPDPVLSPTHLKIDITLCRTDQIPETALDPIRNMLSKIEGVVELSVHPYDIQITVDYYKWPEIEPTVLAVAKNCQALAMLVDNPFSTY